MASQLVQYRRYPITKLFTPHFSQVRNERNKAREESKQLSLKLDGAMKEAHSLKREKNELYFIILGLFRLLTSV